MAKLPQPTLDAIWSLYESREAEAPKRGYLGGSEIGEECARRLWYSFRHVKQEKFSGRVLRLFETGHNEELRVVQNLRDIGCEVLTEDPQTGQQFRFDSLAGHLSGGIDGAVLGLPEAPKTWHLLECKTSNTKNFKKLQKEGVQKAKPMHFAQMQTYMHLGKFTRAVYICVNKDTDDIHLERVNYNKIEAERLISRARGVIESAQPPEKISSNPSWWQCKFCPYIDVCQTGDEIPAKNCRTCVHASADTKDGGWRCANDYEISDKCSEHIFIPALLPWAAPLDGEPEWVKYENARNGKQFINAAGTAFNSDLINLPAWSSEEMAQQEPAVIGDPTVEMLRAELGGVVESSKKVDA